MPKIKKTRLELFLEEKYESNFYTAMTAMIFIGLLLVATASFANHDWNKPNVYQFPAQDLITMDVVKNDGIEGGGTYVCKDVWSCYMYVMSAEKRGATQYCKTIDIRKNGRRVWFKRYQ